MSKILVVEDDDFIREMICKVLVKAGYEVSQASNGAGGIESARLSLPDLVIIDMLMPDKEGVETILELQVLSPGIKIVAISSGGRTKNMAFLEMAQKVGAQRTLSKPFRPLQLLEAVSQLLD